MNEELKNNLSTLIRTFNDKRVVTEPEMQNVLKAIVSILSEHKKGVDSLNAETKQSLDSALEYISGEHKTLIKQITSDLTKSRVEIDKATKEQNNRAFVRLQELISQIKLPKDGKDGTNGKDGKEGTPGRDGSPDTGENIVDKVNALPTDNDDDKIDVLHIKGLEKYFGKVYKQGKQLIVGGIRFFENLADVSIVPAKKRQDLVAQYNTTNNRWQDGVAITVSTTAPLNPQVNDIWIDVS